jgi:glycerol-3-phosphate acyltransferase PlsX
MGPVTVAVDAGGADAGAAEVAAGAVIAAQGEDLNVLLFGPIAELQRGVDELGGSQSVQLVDAPTSIAKAPDPAAAVRATPEASIVKAAAAVAAGEAQAFVSGGGTGAALASGTLIVKRSPGIYRPALAVPVPRPGRDGALTLLDVGANSEVRPEHLVQFAFMGAALARLVLDIERPTVALLSNGSEADRGRDEVIAAHQRLAELDGLSFVGNVEGNDLLSGAADVVVTDGFTGNVVLKTAEGVSQTVLKAVRDAAMASTRGKVGGLLLKPGVAGLRDEIDPERYGGAYLLGLRALGVVPHGRFSRNGIAQAIRLAARGVQAGLVDSLQVELADAGALRRGAAGSSNFSDQ